MIKSLINLIYKLSKPIINEKEEEAINKIEHKSRMESAHELLSTFFFVYFPKCVDKAFVLDLVKLGILGHDFGDANINRVGQESGDHV